jgi:hypothetical protein
LSQICSWIHRRLESLPSVIYPFDLKKLPNNGIYFFYEKGEDASHNNGQQLPRIVRIGTHREGNFRSRISEHFIFHESRLNFSKNNSKPSDRSVFRQNLGRALLNKQNDEYLKIWNIDFLNKENRFKFGETRDIEKEMKLEKEISRLLRENFYFKFIFFEGQNQRMGKQGLESRLIGTIASCELCSASKSWLGKFSPIRQIREGKLWLY